MEVREYLEVGIQTLAMLHAGVLDLDCSKCPDELAASRNCQQEDRGDPVFFDVERLIEFHACPVSLIPRIVYDWYDRYSFQKEFNQCDNYDECDAMYWWFVKTYNKTLHAKYKQKD